MRKSLGRRHKLSAWAVLGALAACQAEGVITEPRLGRLEYVAGNNQIGTVGLNLAQQLVVRLVDQNGYPVAGQWVEFTPLEAGATASPAADTTGADGIASTQLRLGPLVHTYTVVAEWVYAGGYSGEPVRFSAAAKAAPPTTLTITGGNNQTRPAGTLLPVALSVRAADAFGNPTPGVSLTFAIATGGGQLSTTSVTSGASGIASTTWTLGSATGPQSVVVFTAGVAPITFLATAQ